MDWVRRVERLEKRLKTAQEAYLEAERLYKLSTATYENTEQDLEDAKLAVKRARGMRDGHQQAL